jgi:hypothetical protein
MDPTTNNKGGQQHNTIQKTKKIGSMDPTKNNKGKNNTTPYEKLKT